MAKGAYIGETNLTRKIKKMYLGADSTAHKVKKGYIGVSGQAKMFYTSDRTWAKYESAIRYRWDQNAAIYGKNSEYNTQYYLYSLDNARIYYWREYTEENGLFVPTPDNVTGHGLSTGHGSHNFGSAEGRAMIGSHTNNTGYPSPKVWIIGETYYVDTFTNQIRISCRVHYYYGYTKGDFVGYVYSTNASEYPTDGNNGAYWYSNRTTDGYDQGTFIENVEAPENTYPENGRHTDGYWYVLQPE